MMTMTASAKLPLDGRRSFSRTSEIGTGPLPCAYPKTLYSYSRQDPRRRRLYRIYYLCLALQPGDAVADAAVADAAVVVVVVAVAAVGWRSCPNSTLPKCLAASASTNDVPQMLPDTSGFGLW